jgi:hypothetical protein
MRCAGFVLKPGPIPGSVNWWREPASAADALDLAQANSLQHLGLYLDDPAIADVQFAGGIQ